MASEEVRKYIGKRYDRRLDYSIYHCSLSGMDDESVDVLNEVILMLLQKKEYELDNLYSSIKGEYRELDFYVLQMIKLNIQSPTSPYRYKYKSVLTDSDVDWQLLEIEDEPYDDAPDYNDRLLEKFHKVDEIYESLQLSETAKRVFEYKFYQGESFTAWKGKEDLRELYAIYNNVIGLIKERLSNNTLF